jgi:tRNA(Ile2) C34 agmatinyltransferase TiaS
MIKCPTCGTKMQGTECSSGYGCLKCGTLCDHKGQVIWKPKILNGKLLT